MSVLFLLCYSVICVVIVLRSFNGEEIVDFFTSIVFLVSYDCGSSVALSIGIVARSAM